MKTRVLLIAAMATFIATQAMPVSMSGDIRPLQRSVTVLWQEVAKLEARIEELEKRSEEK